jgi:hypothetical protein
MPLTREQVIVTRFCVEAEIKRVEKFVEEHGGLEDPLNNPFKFWLEVARDAQQELINQQEGK